MSMEEVARRAGVSTATVSRVMNNKTVVKSATRNRVMRVITELNYHPNLLARTLAGGCSRTLGMILSNMENPFFLDVYRAAEALAHTHGYEVAAVNTGYRPEKLLAGIRMMIGRRVAGLAVIASEMEPSFLNEVTESKIPAVFYDLGSSSHGVQNIRVNCRPGIGRIVDYLHDLGHRGFAYIGHHPAYGPAGEREVTFVESVKRLGSVWRTACAQDSLEGGRQAARLLLESGFRPTAVICVNDFMAVGALRELRDRGLRVPQDVSVTGFDNIKLSEFCHPALTTVHIPRERIGRRVVAMLCPEEGSTTAGDIVIDPELVLRGSTGPAPA
ncbi:MAG: LacI family DNA-binding transcriptional regulator [Bryobacterales bacterium]|nr:LacI family DNA-binding transcriptional regulator [Bryobacterales bacterium]